MSRFLYKSKMTRSNLLDLTHIILIIALSSVEGVIDQTMVITGDRQIGGHAYITCNWVPNDYTIIRIWVQSLPVPTSESYSFIFVLYGAGQTVYSGAQAENRHSYVLNFTGGSFTVAVGNLSCADERDFQCNYEAGKQGGNSHTIESTKRLIIKAPPSAPDLTISPVSNSTRLELVALQPGTTLSFVCNANVGRAGVGNIIWSFFRGCVAEPVDVNDPRIISRTSLPPRSGDPVCIQRLEHVLRLKVTEKDNDMIVACFVKNDDFPRKIDACINPVLDVCGRSPPIWIDTGKEDSSEAIPWMELAIGFAAGLLLAILLIIIFLLVRRKKRKDADAQTDPDPVYMFEEVLEENVEEISETEEAESVVG